MLPVYANSWDKVSTVGSRFLNCIELNVVRHLFRAWEHISSSCFDSFEQFVVDIGPVRVSLKIIQF